jgi:hypothetical protein
MKKRKVSLTMSKEETLQAAKKEEPFQLQQL